MISKNNKIIVPLDGSPLALESLPLALKLTQLLQGQLYLLRVVPPIKENFLWDWSYAAPANQKEAAEEYLKTIVKDLTGSVENQLSEVPISYLVVEGHSVGQAIAEEAYKQEATVIIMTTHGRSGLSELVLGSTAHELIRHTSLPVIFLRPGPTTLQPAEQDAPMGLPLIPYRELAGPLVVALDGSKEAEVSLDAAFSLSRQLHLPLHLLRVIPPFVPVDELAPWYEANLNQGYEYLHKYDFLQVKEDTVRYLKNLAARKNLGDLKDKIALRVGDPVGEITDYATRKNATFVVMATHPHGRLEQAVLGTVAGSVLSQGNFPVLMVNVGSPRPC